jgi:hypothetical protein
LRLWKSIKPTVEKLPLAGALDTPEAAVVTQVVEDAERFYAKAEIEIIGRNLAIAGFLAPTALLAAPSYRKQRHYLGARH